MFFWCELTSSQIILSVLYKILEKYLRNSFSLFMLAEIQQLVNEMSSSQEVFYKKGVPINFSKFTGKHKKQSARGVLLKLCS